jgi:hypothetical protein
MKIKLKIFSGLMFLAFVLSSFCRSANGDELDDRVKFWESKAFTCNEQPHPFPSKPKTPTATSPSTCDDGDMTLFNGLLCAAGDSRGCDGVKFAQSADGQWWRSPRLVNKPYENGALFSPDMALGVLHYAVAKSDSASLSSWATWLDAERPCIIGSEPYCGRGWPRFCSDDASDKGCTFRPTNCDDLEKVGSFVGASGTDLCRKVLSSFKIDATYILPTSELALADTLFNDRGFPAHLAAVRIFLLQRINIRTTEITAGAVTLAVRQPQNPFFVYLANGPTKEVADLLLRECPKPGDAPGDSSQWAWERDTSEAAWKNSMYWDCLFIARLLGHPKA